MHIPPVSHSPAVSAPLTTQSCRLQSSSGQLVTATGGPEPLPSTTGTPHRKQPLRPPSRRSTSRPERTALSLTGRPRAYLRQRPQLNLKLHRAGAGARRWPARAECCAATSTSCCSPRPRPRPRAPVSPAPTLARTAKGGPTPSRAAAGRRLRPPALLGPRHATVLVGSVRQSSVCGEGCMGRRAASWAVLGTCSTFCTSRRVIAR